MLVEESNLKYNVANETLGFVGSMAFEAENLTGIIRVKSAGFWSLRQIEEYFLNYNDCVRNFHVRDVHVASICDLREAATQSREVTDLLSIRVADLYTPGDRVAMIVPNSLVKMQMRRVLDGRYHEFFLSLSAGERWALAHKHAFAAS